MRSSVQYEAGALCKFGCPYMACRGLGLASIRDLLIITHGGNGCSYFAWTPKRLEDASHHFGTHCFSTDMTEEDVIFGGEKKLYQAIKEAVQLFNPRVIAVQRTLTQQTPSKTNMYRNYREITDKPNQPV